jgi:hypothetical protein
MDDEDIVGQFLSDETVQDPNGFVTTTKLHVRFDEWRNEQGLQKSWTIMALQKELAKRAGLEAWRTNAGRGFKGLVLKGSLAGTPVRLRFRTRCRKRWSRSGAQLDWSS